MKEKLARLLKRLRTAQGMTRTDRQLLRWAGLRRGSTGWGAIVLS